MDPIEEGEAVIAGEIEDTDSDCTPVPDTEDIAMGISVEESRLEGLEKRHIKLSLEIDELLEAIEEEKLMYHQVVDRIIKKRAEIARIYLDHLDLALSPIDSSTNIIEASKASVGDVKQDIQSTPKDFDIKLDIDQIRKDLLDRDIYSKKSYMESLREHLQLKKNNSNDSDD